jgi:hypothetical protein
MPVKPTVSARPTLGAKTAGFGQKNVQLTLPLSPEITAIFSWANFRGYSWLTGDEVENLNRMTRGHADKEFISPYPVKKWIWFRRLPIDPGFFIKFLKSKFKWMAHDVKNWWLLRKTYGRNK